VNIDEINRGPAKLSLANTQLSPTNSDIARPMILPIKSDGHHDSTAPKHSSQPRSTNYGDQVRVSIHKPSLPLNLSPQRPLIPSMKYNAPFRQPGGPATPSATAAPPPPPSQNNHNISAQESPSIRSQPIPSGPFQLTPHIAATLKIPYPGGGHTITPHLLIEFINISVIKSPPSPLHENLQPGMTPYEVVLTSQLLPGAEVVVAYPNQPVIWQGKEDGPERTSALNK
jgi:hypothetical protein